MNVVSRQASGSGVPRGATSGVFVGVALVVALATLCSRLGGAMPQISNGGDVLSVAFGDAKHVISLSMVQKADSYFHGGIDMDCHAAHGKHEHHEGEGEHECPVCHGRHEGHHHQDGHGESEGHSEEEGHEESGEVICGFPDPWRWIDSRIRAPDVHRHLEGAEAIHTIPWLWASVHADPHNVDAWTTAWYIAHNTIRDEDLAWRIIEEGKLKNPESLEILYYEARHVYDSGRGDVAKGEALFRSIEEKALARCGGNESALAENDAWMLKFARGFLAEIAKKRAAK